MDYTSRYKKLNQFQKQAVDTIDGPVRVIAGPGTGKTELLAMRVASILKKTDTLPESILLLTFTESGADAMRRRLTSIIGSDAYKVYIHTFHSFGSELISTNSEFFYNGARFHASDELKTHQILSDILDELDRDNPLKKQFNDSYVYLSDIRSTISDLKRSSLTSDELLEVLSSNSRTIDSAERVLAPLFNGTITKKLLPRLDDTLKALKAIPQESRIPTVQPLATLIAASFQRMAEDAITHDSTKPITAWKKQWLRRDEHNHIVLADRERQIKLHALCYVYFQYGQMMEQAELYDFDDMIMRVVHGLEVIPDFRFNVQEKYHYIMVDEFQDTNKGQMRLLMNLTNNPVLEGKPNILVVGDDDQAIYSFQGADSNNFESFSALFPDTVTIGLVDNYRSVEPVLDHAQSVIRLGTNRLETLLPGLDKTLKAHYIDDQLVSKPAVQLLSYQSPHSERVALVNRIKQSLEMGTQAGDIAVLARRHSELVELVPYFTRAGIPVAYERRDNVLDNELITCLERIARIIIGMRDKNFSVVNALLPELLSHPAFNFTPEQLWRLSLSSYSNRRSWLEELAVTPEFVAVYEWLIASAAKLDHTPLERMIDMIIGSTPPSFVAMIRSDTLNTTVTDTYISPLYQFYFSNDQYTTEAEKFLSFLSSLQTLREKLRTFLSVSSEDESDEQPSLRSLIEFIDLTRSQGTPIVAVTNDTSSVQASQTGVNLMTAHKAKGLEFNLVYIIGAVDSKWGERVRSRSSAISYPANLMIATGKDTADERIRLFFVAMTRARSQLSISFSVRDAAHKPHLPAGFLTAEAWSITDGDATSNIQNDENSESMDSRLLEWYAPLVEPISSLMRDQLRPQLDLYKLSATHLNTFIDITRGGPQNFLLHNLLRFPVSMGPAAGFGTAIHRALQYAHAHVVAHGTARPLEDVLSDYETALLEQRLSDSEYDEYAQIGCDVLTAFLRIKQETFTTKQKTEVSFKRQNVVVGTAQLTGSLDLIDLDLKRGYIKVTDYKTGRPSTSWKGKTDYEKIKLHKYKQQLMFYDLLLKHSRDYSKLVQEPAVLQFIEPTKTGEIMALEAEFTAEESERFTLLVERIYERITTLNLPDITGYDQTYAGIIKFEQDIIDKNI